MPTYHHGLCAAGEGQYLPAAIVEYLSNTLICLPIIMVCVLPGRAGICTLLLLSIQYTDMPTYHHGLRAAGEGQYLPAATVEYLGGAAARLAHHADRLHSLLVGQTHHNLKRTKINT